MSLDGLHTRAEVGQAGGCPSKSRMLSKAIVLWYAVLTAAGAWAQAPAPWVSTEDDPQPLPVSPRPTPRPSAPPDPRDEIVPFNRLAKDNIAVQAKQSSSSDRFPDAVASRAPLPVTTKIVQVELTAKSTEAGPAVVEFYTVHREKGRDMISSAKRQTSANGSGSYQFKTLSIVVPPVKATAASAPPSNGAFLIGWFVRVLRDGKVVGYAGSAPAFDLLAQDPRELAARRGR